MINESESRAKIEKVITQLTKVFDKNKLTIPEILIVYGNLGYSLGASIRKSIDPNSSIPTSEELELLYATNPTVDISLLIQGLLIISWADSLNKKVEDFKKPIENKI